MAAARIPGLIRRLYPRIICRMPPEERKIYLTFDDGPTPVITARVLEILDRYKAGATFFCIGRNAERHPEIFEQIVQAGHAVGNHTYSHLKGWYNRNSVYYDDIRLCSQFVPSRLYRPAYGMITPAQVRYLEKQFTLVLWDVMSYDFSYRVSPETCLANVIRYSRPGSVVVFHDSLKASAKVLYALPKVLDWFGEQGYGFGKIDGSGIA